MAVLVKNAQMTEDAPGVMPLGGGKLWPPTFQTANPTRLPDVHVFHIVVVMAGYGDATECCAHPSMSRTSPISTLAGGVSLPGSPGAMATSGSSSASICRSVSGRVTTQPGIGIAFTTA